MHWNSPHGINIALFQILYRRPQTVYATSRCQSTTRWRHRLLLPEKPLAVAYCALRAPIQYLLQASLVPEDPPPKQVRPRLVSQLLSRFLKPCLHTVAEKCDCRRKRRDNGEIRRLSHFPATVALFCDKLSHFSATVWTGFNKHRVPNKCQFRRTLEATQSCQSTIRIRVTSFLPEHLALTEIIPF